MGSESKKAFPAKAGWEREKPEKGFLWAGETPHNQIYSF
ncbi:hypothetical protein AVDCRST_MAG84-6275 [uncultured Microcoleus sp.]|uniref:Uncharacterized protein n=1 Tax=uncultured Microcoleus sp. TaxID=259945 RepID=A0A6J4P3L0_9CYAN|nr:hypothetical protein AVDCRST_MAG84-6275 [uncultured Microcoleus sp.]